MEIFKKTAKFLVAGLFTLVGAGCSTLDHKSVEPWQGKIWRGLVERNIIDTIEFLPTNREWIASTKYDVNRDSGMRMARVHFSAGWNSVIANAMVPDSVEFADIPRGTLVDIMTETGPNVDYSTQRFSRILRVVCATSDESCFSKEKEAKRIGTIINNEPVDVNAKYAVTYDRRVTKGEVKKYE